MLNKIIDPFRTPLLHKHWLRHYAGALEAFRNIHAGEDCFIIGNGPSLNKMDLTLLNDYYTFGLNKIYLIFERQALKPSYHVAVNPLVIEQGKDEFPKLSCDSFLAFTSGRKFKVNGPNIHLLGDIYQQLELFYKDLTQGITFGYTVTYVAMQIAYFMGFKHVFLVGVDHNFVQKGNPNDKQVMTGNDQNHFDPNYFKGQQWHLADLEHSELYYTIARYIFEHDGRSICDATIDGKCDIFEKLSFEQALSIAKKRTL
jgi:hypothetical protein